MEGKQLLNRKTYKDIKKFDRQQMEDFFRDKYEIGFKNGFAYGVASSEKADTKIQLVQVLQNTKGVGPKIIANALQALKEIEETINE